MAGTYNHPMANMGEYDDTMIAHVSPGEFIVPRPILEANPNLARYIAQVISKAGVDPRQYQVGSQQGDINPHTGQPQYGWFKKIFKNKAFRMLAPLALNFIPGVGTALGGFLGATTAAGKLALGNAILGAGIGGVAGGGLKGAALGGISGGVGGYIQGAGGLAGAANNLGFGNAAYSALDSGILSAGSGMLGGAKDALTAISLGSAMMGSGQQKQALKSQKIGSPAITQFSPERPAAVARPSSLSDLSGFSPEQERSYLATQGANTGLGATENDYYKNLVQRSLVGENNQVVSNESQFLSPIESQYFSGQGYNTNNPMDFLRSLHG